MNILLNNKQKQSLIKMASRLNCSKGNVLQKALALLQVVLREKKQGNTIAIINNGIVIKEITGILSESDI